MANPEFTVEAVFGDAAMRVSVRSDIISDIVAGWPKLLSEARVDDPREDSRQLVVQSLMEETHRDPEMARNVTAALVWLTATGPHGEKLLPFMTAGDMLVRYEITRIGPTSFNFQLSVDKKTNAAMSR